MKCIALTGPESSGKTTLALQIAEHYNTTAVFEYAREYLEESNGQYNESDLVKIAHGHLKSILSEKRKEKELIVVDTDFIVMGIWSKYKYDRLDKEIEALIKSNIFDLHILCSPDIPWEYDHLRENSNNRNQLFELYQRDLEAYAKEYIIVNGSEKERLKKAVQAIDRL